MTKNVPSNPSKPDPNKPDFGGEIPQKIGRYKIEGLLARGGMSLLYLAVHPETSEPIIVKVLLPKFLSNQDVVARFLNEAHIISLADHPNIIKLYNYGQWEEGLYIAMEFVRGSSLRKILAHQPFSLRRSLEVILQIAYALCHLHTQGIIHGDLKPENILITDEGQVKVIDFGIAQMLTERQSQKTDTDLKTAPKIIGTPIYMSPEAQREPLAMHFQSDIYSLGIIAYELVLGKITHGRVILSLAPKGMQKILNKALQPRLEDRYQDIVDFITDLSNYMNSQDVEKDKQGSDYFFELFGRLENFQVALLPSKLPHWEGLEMGLERVFGVGLGGLYYDFFDISPTQKVLFAATLENKGAEGVLFSSMLRTLCHTLMRNQNWTTPSAFFEQIESEIKASIFDEKFNLALLFLDLETKHFEYLDHNFGLFFSAKEKPKKGKAKGEAKGADTKGTYLHLSGNIEADDTLLFFGFTPQIAHTLKEKVVEDAFQQTAALGAQKQAESILRKMRLSADVLSYEHPLLMIILQIK